MTRKQKIRRRAHETVPLCSRHGRRDVTIPAIFYATGSTVTSLVGTAVAVALAYMNMPLIVVALAASAAAYLVGFFF